MEKLNVPLLISSKKKNLNGRIYSKRLMNKILKDLKSKSDICPLLGEIEHPSTFEVNLSKISHSIKNLRIENNILIGDINVLSTPKGDILKEIIDLCVFRPRGVGCVDEKGNVLDGYKILAFDAIPKDSDSFKNIL